MRELTPKAERQLQFMFQVLFDQARSKYISGSHAANGCRQVVAIVEGIGPCRLMEQNPSTGSCYAEYARRGHRIAWLMAPEGRVFLGPVLSQDGEEIRITTGPALKAEIAGGPVHA